MAEDNRLIEIMAELLAEVHQMRTDNNDRLDRLKNQMAKNTAAVGELRLSVVRLADRVEEIHKLARRARVPESIVFLKPPLQVA